MRILYLSQRLFTHRLTGAGVHDRRVYQFLRDRHDVALMSAWGSPEEWARLLNGMSPRPATTPPAWMDVSLNRKRGVIRALIDCARGGIWTYCPDYYSDFEAAVARALAGASAAPPFDLVWADGYYGAPYLRAARGTPSILMTRDSQTRYHRSCLRVRPSMVGRLKAWRLARFERRFYREAGRVVFLTQADADAHAALDPAARTAVVDHGVDFDPQAGESPGADASILFHGAMTYAPNADAAEWFARRVLPLLAREAPSAEFVIAGDSPGPRVESLARLGRIRVTGRVDDLRPYVRRAGVVVCPLRFGSGVKTKVLEAMALGKAIVATPLCLDGIHAQKDRDLLTATAPDEFAGAVAALLRDPGRRRELGAAARRAIAAHHTWDRHFAQIEALMAGLIGEKTV